MKKIKILLVCLLSLTVGCSTVKSIKKVQSNVVETTDSIKDVAVKAKNIVADVKDVVADTKEILRETKDKVSTPITKQEEKGIFKEAIEKEKQIIVAVKNSIINKSTNTAVIDEEQAMSGIKDLFTLFLMTKNPLYLLLAVICLIALVIIKRRKK